MNIKNGQFMWVIKDTSDIVYQSEVSFDSYGACF